LGQRPFFFTGEQIPIGFRLTDAFGNYISTLSAVTALQAIYPDGSAHAIPHLRYFAPLNAYLTLWETKGLAAGSYTISLSLLDGTTHTATVLIKAVPRAADQTTNLAGTGSSATTPLASSQPNSTQLLQTVNVGLFAGPAHTAYWTFSTATPDLLNDDRDSTPPSFLSPPVAGADSRAALQAQAMLGGSDEDAVDKVFSEWQPNVDVGQR
jgi:hypothetical protein